MCSHLLQNNSRRGYGRSPERRHGYDPREEERLEEYEKEEYSRDRERRAQHRGGGAYDTPTQYSSEYPGSGSPSFPPKYSSEYPESGPPRYPLKHSSEYPDGGFPRHPHRHSSEYPESGRGHDTYVESGASYVGYPESSSGYSKPLGYTGKPHHTPVKNKSLDLQTLTQILSQRAGQNVQPGNIRTTLYSMFGEEASPMVKIFVNMFLEKVINYWTNNVCKAC